MAGHQNNKAFHRRTATALTLAFASIACAATAGTEIALRFHDDNTAARGAALSPTAQSVVEKTAGVSLVARGRDVDGAFRFAFALEPTQAQLRDALNRLRATGALVYADVASDDAGVRAKYYAQPEGNTVTSLIVRMKNGASTTPNLSAKLGAKSGTAIDATLSLADGSQVVYLRRPVSQQAAAKLLQALKSDPEIAHVEIDRRAKTQAAPSDPMYATQWNLTDPVGGIAAPRAWDLTIGDASAPIAVLDTGMLPHPDLAGRVIGGYDFVNDVRFSGDGDGRDADPTDPGDFVTAEEAQTPGSPLQGCSETNSTWHGTMVGGTLGAAANGMGMSGVNWTSPLVNVRVMGKCGGALSDVADGIRWASGLAVAGAPANPNPARVINLSLAGPGECSPILQSAITAAVANGSVVIVAAGNDNDDVANHWPANCMGVVVVAATSKDGSRAFYSNSGSRVAIAAPGGGIGGSIPVLRNSGRTAPDPSGYGYGSQLGSSLAAPHVAGLASLVLAMDRSMSPAEVRAMIEMHARPFPQVASEACTANTCGAGIADAGVTIASMATTGQPAPAPAPAPAPPPPQTVPAPAPAPMPAPAPSQPSPDPVPTPAPAPAPPPVLIPTGGDWQPKPAEDGESLAKRAQPARTVSSTKGTVLSIGQQR